MTPKERTNKILKQFFTNGEIEANPELYTEIISQIAEAEREQWAEAMKRLDGIKEEGISIGFSAAREMAKGIADGGCVDGDDCGRKLPMCRYCKIADRIASMTPGVAKMSPTDEKPLTEPK